jgi:3-oxoacyl-[acyl-carrier-protein] synthase II
MTSVITGWSAISPFGVGRDALVEGLRSGRSAIGPINPDHWPVPATEAGLVPDFDPAALLGRKGTKSLDRVSALALCVFGGVGDPEAPRPLAAPADDTALVLGTTTGSVQSMMEFTKSSLTASKPIYVDPAAMPRAVMNCAAGLCAIRYGLKGPNSTVAGGRAAGLLGLGYARRLLANGRATRVLCGSVEEYSVARAWLEHHRWSDRGNVVLGEGGAVFRLEPDAENPLAEVLAVTSRVHGDDDLAEVGRQTVRDALDQAGVGLSDVWAALPAGWPPAPLAEFAPEVRDRVPDPAAVLGDTGAGAASFAVAALLAAAQYRPEAAGRPAVVIAVDPDGVVAAVVLRLTATSDHTQIHRLPLARKA